MLAEWIEQLEGLGLHGSAAEHGPVRNGVHYGTLHIARGRATQDYELHYGAHVTLSTAPAGEVGAPPFVLTIHVATRTAEAFRRAGIQYLDSAGNAWITFADVLIDVRGRSRASMVTRPRTSAGNLFSSGRSQVVLALLAWPQLWDAPQRAIAYAAGVSVGQVNETLKLLRQSGYSRTGARRDQTDLLDLWAAAFPAGLGHRLTLGRYAGKGSITSEWIDKTSESGAAAVRDLLRSESAVYYIDEFDARLPVLHKWRSDGDPNITVRRRFWRDPNPASGARTAPWPIVYADLLASEDPREHAAAAEWRERHARPDQHA